MSSSGHVSFFDDSFLFLPTPETVRGLSSRNTSVLYLTRAEFILGVQTLPSYNGKFMTKLIVSVFFFSCPKLDITNWLHNFLKKKRKRTFLRRVT